MCSILGANGLPQPDVDVWAFGLAEKAFVDGGPIGT